jgi:hypothetical protein
VGQLPGSVRDSDVNDYTSILCDNPRRWASVSSIFTVSYFSLGSCTSILSDEKMTVIPCSSQMTVKPSRYCNSGCSVSTRLPASAPADTFSALSSLLVQERLICERRMQPNGSQLPPCRTQREHRHLRKARRMRQPRLQRSAWTA